MLIKSILEYFPEKISIVILKFFEDDIDTKNKQIEEIRLRSNKPIILKFNNYEKIFKVIVSQEEIIEVLQHICENSIYSYQNEMCNGYITVKGRT